VGRAIRPVCAASVKAGFMPKLTVS
jgi:hypothetical protein